MGLVQAVFLGDSLALLVKTCVPEASLMIDSRNRIC